MMLKFQAQVYRINDILGWSERKELRLSPEFQRRRVWSPRGRSYLIDSIVRGLPMPQFFIREIVLTKERRTVREVVDGQQRLSSILDYLADKFAIAPMHNADFGGTSFSHLPEKVQKEILSYPLSVNVLEGVEDPDVLAIFARLNSYTVPLNRQEKLNAEYVGQFKQAMLKLARDHYRYWSRHKVFSSQAVARMRDVEFTCELVAAMLQGLQNKKTIIAELYGKYDEAFPQFTYIEPRFADILDFCERVMGGDIGATEFKRLSLFYSLFAVAYDLKYGFQSQIRVKAKRELDVGLVRAQEQLLRLNEALSDDRKAPEFASFYEATRQSTDKIQQRTIRDKTIRQILSLCFR